MTRTAMLKYGVLGVAGILLTALGYHGAGWVEVLGSTRPDRPVVHLERTKWDFGTVKPGETPVANFAIVNRGRQRLILRKLNGGCDCMVVREAEIIVPPGSSHRIELTLDAEGMGGKVEFETRYRTSDPAHPVLSLTCSAEVQPATTPGR